MAEKPTLVVEIHTTDRVRFKRCRLQWHFESNLRLDLRPVLSQPPLLFGTAIHKGLEKYYDPSFETRDASRAVDTFQRFMRLYRESLGPDISPDDEQRYLDMRTLGTNMLTDYGIWAPTNRYEDFTVIEVEKEYIVELPELQWLADKLGYERIVYSFRLDALIQSNKDGRYWIGEYKTIDKAPDNFEWLVMDEQPGSYIWGVKRVLDIEVAGVLYTWLRKKSPTPLKEVRGGWLTTDKRTDTTYERARQEIKAYHEGADIEVLREHYQEFLNHLRDKDLAAGGSTFFFREQVRRNPQEIEALGQSICMEIEDMLDNPKIYRNPNRYNCNSCAFQGPCIGYYEGIDIEPMLAGDYVKGKLEWERKAARL